MSVPANGQEFLELVRKSGLVEPPQLSKYTPAPDAEPPPPRQLADSMIRDGVLTHYQAGLLMKGRWRNFVVAGKYKVLEHLGTGGMGSVYLCEHLVMKRRVALKVLPNKGGPTAVERFKREARAAAALDHPNIVRAHDIDSAGPLTFLVMEYVDGASLQGVVAKAGPLSVERACHYIAQAALGLQHAFEAGLVHRDIKPGNILLARDGTVKVLDMGLARFTEQDEDNLTRDHEANSILGTADYLAPEQAIDSSAVDIRADIYSLGATFYFLLTGSSPVGQGTLTQKLVRHQMKQAPSVRQARPEVPEELAAILDKMLAKDPADRFQTPVEVAEALLPWTSEAIDPPSPDEMPSAADRRGSEAVKATDPTRPMTASSIRKPIGLAARPGSSVVLATPRMDSADSGSGSSVIPTPPSPQPLIRHGFLLGLLITFLLGAVAVVGILYALGVPLWDNIPTFEPNKKVFYPTLLRQFHGHTASVERLALMSDGKTLVTCSTDKTVRVWNLEEDKPLVTFDRHKSPIRYVAADRNSMRAATSGEDGMIVLWDVAARKEIRNWTGPGGMVWCIDFSPDGKRLAAASVDKKLRIWEVETGKLIKEFVAAGDKLHTVGYLPDGKHVVVGSLDKTARLWDTEEGKEVRKYSGHADQITSLAVSPDGKRFITGSPDKTVRVWDVGADKPAMVLEGPGPVWTVAWSQDGSKIAAAGNDRLIRVYDAELGRPVTTWNAHGSGVTKVEWLSDGRRLVSCSHDKSAILWQALAANLKN